MRQVVHSFINSTTFHRVKAGPSAVDAQRARPERRAGRQGRTKRRHTSRARPKGAASRSCSGSRAASRFLLVCVVVCECVEAHFQGGYTDTSVHSATRYSHKVNLATVCNQQRWPSLNPFLLPSIISSNIANIILASFPLTSYRTSYPTRETSVHPLPLAFLLSNPFPTNPPVCLAIRRTDYRHDGCRAQKRGNDWHLGQEIEWMRSGGSTSEKRKERCDDARRKQRRDRLVVSAQPCTILHSL